MGVPDDVTGEAVKALVVTAAEGGPDVEELMAGCAVRLARFKRPTVIELVTELPHSGTGKISRVRCGSGSPGAGMSAAVVTLIGKPDCHLCDQAREVVVPVCAEVGADFQELSVRDSPVLRPIRRVDPGGAHQRGAAPALADFRVLLRQALATSMK